MVIDYANSSDLDSTNNYTEACDLYARTTHRVRKALFPEILIEDDVNIDEYNGYQSTSIVGQFAEPSQLLKAAILDLLSVRDQLEDAANNIPQLIHSLHDSDPVVVGNAARLVYLLSKEDKCVASLANNERLVGALVKTIGTSNNNDTKRDALAALSHISNFEYGRMHIFRTRGIPELVRMLQSRIDVVVHYAVTTLHNLLVYVDETKTEIISCGGLEGLVPHLNSKNSKLQALVADCLYFLLLDQPQCKQSFLSLQGPRYLVSILQSNTNYVKLIYAVVRCIRSISTCAQNKASLISLGGLEALHQTLGVVYENKRKLAILNAMRNLSDVATNLDTLTNLVGDLINLVDNSNDEEIVSCACGILSNLTCNNILNKQTVCQNHGAPILARVLARFPNIEDITEPSLCTLRHCTVRHPLAKQAQNELQFSHPIILDLLATRRPPIVKAALGLVRNCALSQPNLQSIISKINSEGDTVVTIALEILEHSGSLLQEDFNGLSEGVSLLEMVEGAISALHQLAKDAYVAKIIYNHVSIMNILGNIMAHEQISNNEDELMMREIMGLIYQLTKSPDGAKAVQMYELQPHIFDALNSSHKSIAAYASIILKNMGIDKPLGYNNSHHFDGQIGNGYANGMMGNGNTDTMGSRRHENGEMGWLNDGMEPELYNELYNYSTFGDLKNDHIVGNAHTGSWFDTDL